MNKVRRIAVMIDLGRVVVHHYQIFAGIQKYAAERGNWECTVDPHADLLLHDWEAASGPDGIVGRATPRLAALSRKTGVPVVNVWFNSPARDLPTVAHNARESGRMAAEHLLARGLRNFGFIGYLREKTTELQSIGFAARVGQAGCTCRQHRLPLNYAAHENWGRFRAKMAKWIESLPRPIGVFVHHDVLARYFVEGCRALRIKVPEEVAVVSGPNEEVVCTRGVPTLSSIDFGFERVGYEAAALLDRLIDGSPPPSETVFIPPKGLVPRQSSDAFFADNPLVAQALLFIAEHAHKSMDVDDVARHVSTTRRTLARLFQRELNQTVFDAITRLRLERAKRRLMEPEVVLKIVARECGFRDAIHLCKVFQRVEGISPSEYRSLRGWKR